MLKQFSFGHLVAIALLIVGFFIIVKLQNKQKNRKFIINIFTICLFISQCFVWGTRIFAPTDEKFIFNVFDLDVCGFIVYACLIFALKPNKFLYNFILLVGPIGTLLAILFPKCQNFPHITYFTFFITHSICLLLTIFIFLSFPEYKITFRWVIFILIFACLIALIAMLVNYQIGSNFMFLNGSVGIKTPLDAFSTTPLLRLAELLPLFFILFLAEFGIYKKIYKK